jgi:hypothetical protein
MEAFHKPILNKSSILLVIPVLKDLLVFKWEVISGKLGAMTPRI